MNNLTKNRCDRPYSVGEKYTFGGLTVTITERYGDFVYAKFDDLDGNLSVTRQFANEHFATIRKPFSQQYAELPVGMRFTIKGDGWDSSNPRMKVTEQVYVTIRNNGYVDDYKITHVDESADIILL
jgi:hypothetical protein